MKIIKEYIQFGRDNLKKTHYFGIDDAELITEIRWDGYQYTIYYEDTAKSQGVNWHIALNSMIMKSEFIQAIARGIIGHIKYMGVDFNSTIEDITYKQAIAIRENKLEEFITNLDLGKTST